MSILQQLSSQSGDRTEQSNVEVARLCLENPILLEDIAEGLFHQDVDLVGDCAEGLTKTAEQRPELVAPYAESLTSLLSHKKTRARWEAVHALALVAALVPEVIQQHFDKRRRSWASPSSTSGTARYGAKSGKDAGESFAVIA